MSFPIHRIPSTHATPVRFGLGAGQRGRLAQINQDHQPGIKRREFIDSIMSSSALSAIAGYYAEVAESGKPFNTREELISALEEALILRLKRAKENFDKNKPDCNDVLKWTIENLDKGRLQGKDLPGPLQTALEEALDADLRMQSRAK